jgi:hypothetical protein
MFEGKDVSGFEPKPKVHARHGIRCSGYNALAVSIANSSAKGIRSAGNTVAQRTINPGLIAQGNFTWLSQIGKSTAARWCEGIPVL